MRSDNGEIELAEDSFVGKAKMPNLIKLEELQGDLHSHTTWSDGANSVEEMVNFYRSKGFKYLALTDHSPSLRVANGLDIGRLRAKNAEIDQLNSKFQDFEILKGSEVDILADGSLDYPDEILEELDVVVAAIHSGFKHDSKTQTERILSAIRNPYVNIIAHPHGRLIGKRDGYQIDLEMIFRAAKEYGVAIEVNSQALRLDLNDVNCRLAKEYGVKLAINSDAHHFEQSEFLTYGVGTARRGWIEAKDVINSWNLIDLKEFLKKKRS
jgi:DNA polymerase (family 10)